VSDETTQGETPKRGPGRPPKEQADVKSLEAYKVGFEDGKKDGYTEGFNKGVVHYREITKPSLFEAAKRWALSVPNFTHRQEYHEGFDKLQAEYGEKLIQSDRDLLIGLAERVRRSTRSAESVTQPQRSRPAPVPSGDDFENPTMTAVRAAS
jgi:hypothetical protein